MNDFITKDSGEREQFDSGMQRDTEAGKPRFDLMIPEGVPFEEQLLTRFAMLLSRGAEKYDARNWEQASGRAEIDRAKSSAFRHFMQWFCGERDEDHAVATFFNIMVVETTERKLARDGDDHDEALAEIDKRAVEGFGPDLLPKHPLMPCVAQPVFAEGDTEAIRTALQESANRRASSDIPVEDLRFDG